MAKLSQIEGVGPAYAWKLKSSGIYTREQLLEKCGTPSGRKALAESSGISANLIRKWTNRADLGRIDGVGGEYMGLLECVGVDTVSELARRDAVALHRKIADLSNEKKLVRVPPSESQVLAWVSQAKSVDRAVHC